jgi:2-polyprenyl-3-methyl-5-hydroxy-6-metoxy-1,4-benzoquinol methylase
MGGALADRLRTAIVGRWQVALRQTNQKLGRHISRDQWGDDTAYVAECRALYDRLMIEDWPVIERTNPQYAERVRITLRHTSGRVLELGAGIGTMTRHLVAKADVTAIIAVEPFEEAVQALRRAGLPKVVAVQSDVVDMKLDGRFDTVLACEFLEHLYADEEREMVARLRNHVGPDTRYVVSVPVGFMPDDFHVRGFTPRRLRRHLDRLLGPVEGVHRVGRYSQIAWGHFR